MATQKDIEYTEDGHYFIVNGRKWRRTDPSLSEEVREALVKELMDARRAVKAAKKADDAGAMADARKRVNEAKVGLGERGTPWWEK